MIFALTEVQVSSKAIRTSISANSFRWFTMLFATYICANKNKANGYIYGAVKGNSDAVYGTSSAGSCNLQNLTEAGRILLGSFKEIMMSVMLSVLAKPKKTC